MHPLQTYLTDIQRDFGTGHAVKETSYYPALSKLFNDVGNTLTPKVFCVTNIANRGAGLPDGGFFSASQRKSAEKDADEQIKDNPLLAMLPERGVLEVKGTLVELADLKQTEQVKRYVEKYGQALLTNLREFQLVERDANGALVDVEGFSLADSSDKFWKLKPQTFTAARGEEFVEFLKRCLLTGAPLTSPQDVAAFLASYAREARLRLERLDLPALLPLKGALENVLGIKFESPDSRLSEEQQQERGDRFFRATLVQTLFYGLFSAWLSHTRDRPDEAFNWKEAQWSLHIPMVGVIFEQLMQPTQLKSLELRELIELAARTLNRVQTGPFFQKWEGALAVQYFYEPFLEKFDPVLRKELGVYYTPPEIVRYMVERVHRVLQSELKRPLGLADPDVVILDPCCGTGTFLVETLRKIAETLAANGAGAFLAHDLKTAATTRVFGFEILPAPFVVAHHGVGSVLAAYDATLQSDERAAIYLTNALTGWMEEPKTKVLFAELEKERESAQRVKRQEKILVILGNPPYDAFAKITEDPDLVQPYKKGLQSEWGIKKFNLDDLYVRFFRVAERRLAQNSEGVLCFISNYSWTSEPSYVVMRQHLLKSFDCIWIENMHGNRKVSERAPDGTTSQTVFALPGFSPGIRQGITISTLVKRKAEPKSELAKVLYRNDLTAASAVERRQQLLETLTEADFDASYETAQPEHSNKFSLRPLSITSDYESWPRLTELCATAPMNGLMEKRGGALISIDHEPLKMRIQAYFDPAVELSALMKVHPGLVTPAARFDPAAAHKKVIQAEEFGETNLLRYAVRPFDLRWCYYTGTRPLWNEPRPVLRAQLWTGNSFLISRPAGVANPEGNPLWFASTLGDNDALRGHAYYFPIFLRHEVEEELVPDGAGGMRVNTRSATTANLSAKARDYLRTLEFADPDEDRAVAALIWHHALAVGYAPAYRAEHADGLSGDWPRVPLPVDADTLQLSARLGGQVAALLDVAASVFGVSTAPLRPGLASLGALERTDGKSIQPDAGDLRIAGNWGYLGGRGEVMAGQGHLTEREPDTTERADLDAAGLTQETHVCDVYLNDCVYWGAVPRSAWETIIGGYQVMKKWLSYRDFKVLGRDLTVAEAREVEAIIRRLTALTALRDTLDENYHACAANAYPL